MSTAGLGFYPYDDDPDDFDADRTPLDEWWPVDDEERLVQMDEEYEHETTEGSE